MKKNNVAFQFIGYRFTKASLDFNIPKDAHFNISFDPKGVLHQNEARYELLFDTKIECKENSQELAFVSCEASFGFMDKVTKEDIPDFFYPNSLAIVFPYIRAFISTLSLQANIIPIVLPTVNLMDITETLKQKTKVQD